MNLQPRSKPLFYLLIFIVLLTLLPGCSAIQAANSPAQHEAAPVMLDTPIRVDTVRVPFTPYEGPMPSRSISSYPNEAGETVYVILEEGGGDVEITFRGSEVVVVLHNRYNKGLLLIDDGRQLLNLPGN